MRDDKDRFVLGLCAASAAIGSASCQANDVSDLFGFRAAPVTDELVIRTLDGRSYEGGAATIEVVAALPKGPSAKAAIAIATAEKSGQGLSIAFDVSTEVLLGRTFKIELGDAPGTGTLALASREGARIIGPGTISLTASSGQIQGQFRTADASFQSGTIEGRYELTCLVTPDMLGLPVEGEASSGTWILVEDELKESDFCRKFVGY